MPKVILPLFVRGVIQARKSLQRKARRPPVVGSKVYPSLSEPYSLDFITVGLFVGIFVPAFDNHLFVLFDSGARLDPVIDKRRNDKTKDRDMIFGLMTENTEVKMKLQAAVFDDAANAAVPTGPDGLLI